jgi:hypothetical protein
VRPHDRQQTTKATVLGKCDHGAGDIFDEFSCAGGVE